MKIEATEFLMEQYGLWVWRDNGVPRCTSPMLAIMLRNPANEKRLRSPTPLISDDCALQVDSFMGTLLKSDPDVVESLTLYFVHDLTFREVGDRMGRSYVDARMLVRAGLSAIAACFLMQDRLAA
ncbi:antiterminator Q family protein [Pseudomonas sp. C9-3]|uniref:antiterminator Q family protein n=1 Tax=Pseudomonas sp. C9-3 TaxID=3078264 RepID=UPI0028E9EB91|nr:antiterminator Q family protein [Pseudomonas sp. C9-3]